jgi:Aspartyl protease
MTKVESCLTEVGFIVEERIIEVLTRAMMFFNDPRLVNINKPRFEVTSIPGNCDNLLLIDQGRDLVTILSRSSLQNPKFNIAEWYKSWLFQVNIDTNVSALEVLEPCWASAIATIATLLENRRWLNDGLSADLELCGIQVDWNQFAALQRSSAIAKDPSWIVPKPIIITVEVNGHPCCALLDTGSLGDLISGSLVDQLKIKKTELNKPVMLNLVVQGFRSKIKSTVTIEMKLEKVELLMLLTSIVTT